MLFLYSGRGREELLVLGAPYSGDLHLSWPIQPRFLGLFALLECVGYPSSRIPLMGQFLQDLFLVALLDPFLHLFNAPNSIQFPILCIDEVRTERIYFWSAGALGQLPLQLWVVVGPYKASVLGILGWLHCPVEVQASVV